MTEEEVKLLHKRIYNLMTKTDLEDESIGLTKYCRDVFKNLSHLMDKKVLYNGKDYSMYNYIIINFILSYIYFIYNHNYFEPSKYRPNKKLFNKLICDIMTFDISNIKRDITYYCISNPSSDVIYDYFKETKISDSFYLSHLFSRVIYPDEFSDNPLIKKRAIKLYGEINELRMLWIWSCMN